jgi:hypothetical protein
MNEARLKIVQQAFKRLDESGTGAVGLATLLKAYRAEAHPRVRVREKTAECVYKDFELAITKRAYFPT